MVAGKHTLVVDHNPIRKIVGIVWDAASHLTGASGSDLWPFTWALNGHQYTIFGDGWGFDGNSGSDGKQSNGFCRVEGPVTAATFRDLSISGDLTPTWTTVHNLGTGKPSSLLAIAHDEFLVAFPNPGSTPEWVEHTSFARSTDELASFTESAEYLNHSDSPPGTDNVTWPGLMQAGQGYLERFDDYVYYIYVIADGASSDLGTSLGLARVKCFGGGDTTANWTDLSKHEHVTAIVDGVPTWGAVGSKIAVQSGADDIGYPQLIYFKKYDQCVLVVRHENAPPQSNFHFMTASRPWGPWTTIPNCKFTDWETNFDTPADMDSGFGCCFAPGWQSGDDFVLVFTGTGNLDSYNTVTGSFVTA